MYKTTKKTNSQSTSKNNSLTPTTIQKQQDVSRLQLYAVKNSITKRYQDERMQPLDFSNSSFISNTSFNQTPDRRNEISKSTRNSSFFSAQDLTPNISNPTAQPPKSITPAHEYDHFLPAALQPPPPPSPIRTRPETSEPIIVPPKPASSVIRQSTPVSNSIKTRDITIKVPEFEGIGVCRRPTVRSKNWIPLRNLVIFKVFGVKFSAKKSIFQNCLSGSPFGLILCQFKKSIFLSTISLQKP